MLPSFLIIFLSITLSYTKHIILQYSVKVVLTLSNWENHNNSNNVSWSPGNKTWRPRRNRLHFVDDIFKYIFVNENYEFRLTFHWRSSLRDQLTVTQHCFNGLAPNRRRAIIWTNTDLIHWRIYSALGGNESNIILTRNLWLTVYTFQVEISKKSIVDIETLICYLLCTITGEADHQFYTDTHRPMGWRK